MEVKIKMANYQPTQQVEDILYHPHEAVKRVLEAKDGLRNVGQCNLGRFAVATWAEAERNLDYERVSSPLSDHLEILHLVRQVPSDKLDDGLVFLKDLAQRLVIGDNPTQEAQQLLNGLVASYSCVDSSDENIGGQD